MDDISLNILLKNVSFRYHQSDRYALNHIGLSIKQGDCILICGRSGCGKSSLTRLFNGLIPEFYTGTLEGQYYWNERQFSEYNMTEISAVVGSIFQNPRAQFFCLNTTEEIILSAQSHGRSQAWIQNRLEQISQSLGLKPLLNRSIFHLSSGEEQLIACASAVFNQPNLILLDEPSANLDFKNIGRLKKIIAEWKKAGVTLIIAEHRLHYLVDLVDSIIYMDDGEIKNIYAPSELMALEKNHYHLLGLRARNLVESLSNRCSSVTTTKPAFIIEKLIFKNQHTLSAKIICGIGFYHQHIYGIIGNNGAGKTNFLKLLAGLKPVSYAAYRFQGQIIKSHQLAKHVYLVLQNVNLQLFSETVRGEVLLSMHTAKQFSHQDKEQKAHDLLVQLGLADEFSTHPMHLSCGQKQCLAIATALASARKILLFDEPTSGLDFSHMHKIAKLIAAAAEQHVVCFTTHDPEFLYACATDLIVIEEEEIKAQAPLASRMGERLMASKFVI